MSSTALADPRVEPVHSKPPPSPRRPHLLRWILGALALLVVAVAVFLALFNWDWFRPPLARMMSARLHRPVRIDGHLRVHLFSWTPSATLDGLKIGEPAWAPKQDMADIDRILLQVELMPLFVGHVVLPRLEIDRPNVFLFQDQTGRANWDFSNGAAPGKPAKLPPIKNFIIDDGHLSVTSLQRRLKFTGTVYAHEKANSGRQAFGLNGQGSLNGKVFQMNATGGPLLNVRTNVPYPFDATMRAGDTRLTAKGRVTHPFNLGQMDAALSVSGRNLADLYYVTGLTLPNTPPYSISAQVDRDELTYTVKDIAGRVGSSDLEGGMKVDTSDHGRPNLTADLSSRVLDFKDMGAVLGATGANAPKAPKLSATPEATQGAAQGGAHRLLPDAPLEVERIRGMDAKVRYHAQSVRALPSLPLRQVSLGATLDHGLLTLDPIDFGFPQGRLTGAARIDARTNQQRDAIDLRLTGLQLANFIAKGGAQPPLEGVLDARAKATAVGDSIHKAAASSDGEVTLVMPGGTVRQSLAELMGIDATKGLFMLLSKDTHATDVRCMIADFRVHNGVMQANDIVLDTGVVQVHGQGVINLNDETVDLTFKGQAKKFRLVKINAPIVIGGHLSSPTFGIKPAGALAQGGVAAVLAAAVNPALLILPFVNLNLAHDANCAGLLSQAKTEGAPTTTHAAPHKVVPPPTPVAKQ
jgi:AsmA family protein